MPPKPRGKSPAKKPATRTASPAKGVAPKVASSKALATADAKKPASTALAKGKSPAGPKPAPSKGAALPANGATAGPGKPPHDTISSLVGAALRAWFARCCTGHRRAAALMAATSDEATTKHFLFEKNRRSARQKVVNAARAEEDKKAALQEAAFVAVFDGDMKAFLGAVARGADIHKPDPQGNVAVGEAAVNGQTDMVKKLVNEYDCDPNAVGAYGRTPLWRAAYNSHIPTMAALLQLGADPRISCQHQLPEDLIKGNEEGEKLLKTWDTAKTDALVATRATRIAALQEKRQQEAQAEKAKLEAVVGDKKGRYTIAQKELSHAKCEVERRITEYDFVNDDPTKSAEIKAIALQCVEEAEAKVAAAEDAMDAAQEAYLDARATLATHQSEECDEEVPGTPIKLTETAEEVLQDRGGKIAASGKWPYITDVSQRVAVFLRYRDTNYLDAFHPVHMEPGALRRALIGSIRYGKPLVLDLHGVPLLDVVRGKFNDLRPGLWERLVSRALLQDRGYLELVTEADGDQYAESKFTRANTEAFVFVVVSSAPVPDDGVLEAFTPFSIEVDD